MSQLLVPSRAQVVEYHAALSRSYAEAHAARRWLEQVLPKDPSRRIVRDTSNPLYGRYVEVMNLEAQLERLVTLAWDSVRRAN